MKIISIVLLAAASVFHVAACGFNKFKARKLSKVLLMPLVCLVYVNHATVVQPFVIIALCWGWIGDLFMIAPEKKTCMAAGILSFGLGHICYMITMHRITGTIRFLPLLGAVVIALAASLFAYSRVTKLIERDLRIPSIVYYLLLTGIAAGSLVVLFQGHAGGAFMLAGSWCFLASDTVLVRQFYTVGNNNGREAVIVMTTYLAAQIFLMCGFLQPIV